MNPHFKQPVFVFGVFAPLLLVVVLLVAGMHFRGRLEETYKERQKHHGQYKMVQAEREGLEREISSQKPHMTRWMALYDKPTTSRINSFLTSFQKRFDSREFKQKAFNRTSSAGVIGGGSRQASIHVQLAFRGTYRALQTAFLELETRMPNLQLDGIRLTANQDHQVLEADVNYTAWQKE